MAACVFDRAGLDFLMTISMLAKYFLTIWTIIPTSLSLLRNFWGTWNRRMAGFRLVRSNPFSRSARNPCPGSWIWPLGCVRATQSAARWWTASLLGVADSNYKPSNVSAFAMAAVTNSCHFFQFITRLHLLVIHRRTHEKSVNFVSFFYASFTSKTVNRSVVFGYDIKAWM